MAVIVDPSEADAVIDALDGAFEEAFVIGQVEEGPRGCTVEGAAGSWGADEDWSASHHG